MQLTWIAQGAVSAQRSRNRIARAGVTMSGSRVWTDKEIVALRLLYPGRSYAQISARLRGRTLASVRHMAQKLGLAPERHIWTAAEISKLRRVYENGTKQELRAAFPHVDGPHLSQIARYHGMRRPRQPFKATGIPAIDQIRHRAFELRYSMPDVDQLARSKKYFQKGGWHAGHINHRAIARAIQALDGAVSARWHD